MPGHFHSPRSAELPAAAISQVYADKAVGSSASVTFVNKSFGAAASDRRLAIHTFGGGTGRTLQALRAGGVDADIKFANQFYAFGIVDLPTGTSGNYYVQWSGTKASFGILVHRITGLITTTPTDGGFAAFSGLVAGNGLAVHAGGVVSGYLYGGGSAGRSVAWAGITEGLDAYIRTTTPDGYDEMHSGAAGAFADVASPAGVTATLSADLADSKAAYIWALR